MPANRLDRDIEARLNLARDWARRAGQVTLDYFQTDSLQVERKADDSPVTAADREAEALIRTQIAAEFPGDTIVGEEEGTRAGDSGYVWAVDPIDGTKTFVAGVPLYTTLIGLMADRRVVAGVVYAPAVGEMVYASAGRGAWLVRGDAAPRRARVSRVPTLAAGRFVTTAVTSFTEFRAVDAADVYARIESAAGLSRTWGDGYGYLLVATGRAEVMVDPILNVWDATAVKAVVEEAGGIFTDWQGRATVDSGEGVATNGHVHEQVLGLIRG
jgi:histidinol phosphatase-like enzyme (inositol monophosphatase family)